MVAERLDFAFRDDGVHLVTAKDRSPANPERVTRMVEVREINSKEVTYIVMLHLISN